MWRWCLDIVWRKAINFTFSSAARREKLRPRGNVYRPREFDRVFEHFHSSSNPSPVQGLPRSKRSNGVNSICWQSCAFWIRGKRPFKPLSKLPSSLLSFFTYLSLSLSLPNVNRTERSCVQSSFECVCERLSRLLSLLVRFYNLLSFQQQTQVCLVIFQICSPLFGLIIFKQILSHSLK